MMKLRIILWALLLLSFGNLGPGVDVDLRVYGEINPLKLSAKSMAVGYDYALYVQNGKAYGFSTYARFSALDNKYQPKKYMDGVKAVYAGEDHYFILREDGSLYGFGSNEYGQLGDGSLEGTMTPKLIMKDVLDVAAGSKFSLIIKKDYSLWGFGLNDKGQLGIGNTVNQTYPIKIMDDMIRISCGVEHSLALSTKGELYGFGDNSLAQLGVANRQPQLSPVHIKDSVEFISAGTSHSLALTFSGELYSFGTNFFGEGVSPELGYHQSPTLILNNVAEIAASYAGSLILDKSGGLRYYGLQEVLDLNKKYDKQGFFDVANASSVHHVGEFAYEGFLELDNDDAYVFIHRNQTATELYTEFKLEDFVNLYGFSINIPVLQKPQYAHEKPSTYKSRLKQKLEDLRLYYERYYKPKVQKPLAITFDDGPSYYTAELLEALKAYNARATFFVLGSQAARHPDVLKMIENYDSEVASHSYYHNSYANFSTQQMLDDLRLTDKAIENAGVRKPYLFRPPYGAYNTETITVLRSEGKALVMWNIDTMDWAYRDAEYVKKYLLNHAREGSIILLHDIHKSSVDGFIAALPELVERGYSLVTVSELLEISGRSIEVGEVIFSAR